jgi:Trk K+ transport system NAD-binding subunit
MEHKDPDQEKPNIHSRESTSTGDYNIKDHVVICNWTDKADVIVRQLHDESVYKKSPIIVVTENPEQVPKSTEKAYRGLLIIGGDPADKEILERADIRTARTAVILANEKDVERADSKSILIQLAIDSINPNVHTIVELVKSSSELYFRYTHVNEIICLEQLAEKLLSQAALTPGLSKVYMNLLTQSLDTNEIYLEELPESFVDHTYEEVEKKIVSIEEKDVILIGWATEVEKRVDGEVVLSSRGIPILEKEIVINPRSSTNSDYSKKHKFKKGDSLFIISYEKPDLKKYFNGDVSIEPGEK